MTIFKTQKFKVRFFQQYDIEACDPIEALDVARQQFYKDTKEIDPDGFGYNINFKGPKGYKPHGLVEKNFEWRP